MFPNKLFGACFIALGPSSSCQFERPSLICLSVGFLSLIHDLIASPLSPTSPSPTEAPLVAPMLPMAGLIIHRHVLIGLFRFHLPTLADTTLRFSHYISTYSNGALNPLCVVASATNPREQCPSLVSLLKSFFLLSQHRPLST